MDYENDPLNQTLDEYISGQKSKRRSLVGGPTSSRISNGRSFNKRNFSYRTKGRSVNNNNRTFPMRNSMPICRRDQCCDRSHCIIRSLQWIACCHAHFLEDIRNNYGIDNNYSYKYKRGNRNLKRALSREIVASVSSFRSNQTASFSNTLTKENINIHNALNENKNVNDDSRSCPLNETTQKQIREIQNQFALTLSPSPVRKANINSSNCRPKQFDTGIKLTVRIGHYYKPIEERIVVNL